MAETIVTVVIKPSPCRFVLYCFRDRFTKMLVERPALVTSVNGESTLANLWVFFERGDSDECCRGDSGDIGFDPRYENVDLNEREIPSQNTWRWPPRV